MATTLPCYYRVCLYFIEQQQVGEFRPLSEDIKVSAGPGCAEKIQSLETAASDVPQLL